MPAPLENPLVRDRDVELLLHEMLDVSALCRLPAFAGHDRETFDMYVASARRLAREVLFPAFKPMDEAPARLEGGRIVAHARMKEIWPRLVELGAISATRPASVGGAALPITVAAMAHAYLMAANASAYGYAGLTNGAAHLLEAFADEPVKRAFMDRLYRGEWTGTMALTEPQAGSSLADVTTKAAPRGDGTYAITGAKIFISGADHDLAANVVNMTLARVEGAPAGIKGISLFAVPREREEHGALVPNDVHVAGVIHKIGWRGLPSLALSFGDQGDCRGWLVGEPHRGLAYMFQMMNEARIMVGLNAASTASVAYHEALAYARMRPQGRPAYAKDPASKQVPILAHADVRRMLLRQKAIVEGSFALLGFASLQADLAEHAAEGAERARARLLVDALTPIAKSFPAEWGFEANALAVQIHGGYGYSSEQLPEAWLREQKLNSIHEGTTGIHGLDLLGRRIVAGGGAALGALGEEIETAARRAEAAGVEGAWIAAVRAASGTLASVTATLGQRGLAGDVEGMLLHSTDFLSLASITVVGWLWLWQASIAKSALARGASGDDIPFYEGKLHAAQYWIATELPKTELLARLCVEAESSYASMRDAAF